IKKTPAPQIIQWFFNHLRLTIELNASYRKIIAGNFSSIGDPPGLLEHPRRFDAVGQTALIESVLKHFQKAGADAPVKTSALHNRNPSTDCSSRRCPFNVKPNIARDFPLQKPGENTTPNARLHTRSGLPSSWISPSPRVSKPIGDMPHACLSERPYQHSAGPDTGIPPQEISWWPGPIEHRRPLCATLSPSRARHPGWSYSSSVSTSISSFAPSAVPERYRANPAMTAEYGER
ncbi:MAG: hypothetical protein WBM59_15835, partial [Sedimenticolaceae bacterium]